MCHYHTGVLIQVYRVICWVYMIMTLRGREKLLKCLSMKLHELALRRPMFLLKSIALCKYLSIRVCPTVLLLLGYRIFNGFLNYLIRFIMLLIIISLRRMRMLDIWRRRLEEFHRAFWRGALAFLYLAPDPRILR